MVQQGIYRERLKKVVDSMETAALDALLLNRTCNIAYLTGTVNSCSWVFITREGKQVALVLDSDAPVYEEESSITDIRTFRDHDPFHLFRSMMKELKLTHSKIGLELCRPGISIHTLELLKHAFPSSVQLVNGEMILEEIRAMKSQEEIEAIKEAGRITELGMKTAIQTIKPGISENEVATEVEYAIKKSGGRIPVINYVASGKRSCIAHHAPSSKKIQPSDVITMDLHGGFQGYSADLSRTVICGKIKKEVKQAYSHLIQAEEEAINLCRHGVKLKEIKKTFYKKLHEAKNFRFLMGPVLHGVGVMNYEMPYFQFPHHEKGYPETLKANMVIALSNIGLYSTQGWGVRVEDTILVTEKEPVYLTNFTKKLLRL